jgi:hypothetical protein
MLNSLSINHREFAVTLVWSIWMSRNNFAMWKGSNENVEMKVGRAQTCLID